MYIDQPIRKYLDDLAAKSPTPGGGSASALAASTGVALMSMVANYTVGNPKYKDVERDAAELAVKAERYRDLLQELIDKDAVAYNKLSNVLKSHSGNVQALEEAYKEAVAPPLEICRISAECLKLCEKLAACGNRSLITDTATAAIMLEGAFFSAKYNVYINLKSVKDMDFVGKVHGMLAPLEESMPKLKEDILEACEDAV